MGVFKTKSAVPSISVVGAYGWPDECQGRKTRTGKKEKEYSAPHQLKKRKKGKESNLLPESSEEKIKGGSPLLPWEESRSDFVMDDRRRRLVEMANRYLRKHCSEDAYNGGDGSSPKRQRLGD
ncbi:unnamed protein product [Linum trigynum]|uniref:Uncharacterized protein n=1 Tax=Linum trigynum TaxID=586398 RepID=A0AAV2F6F1_9ROSI